MPRWPTKKSEEKVPESEESVEPVSESAPEPVKVAPAKRSEVAEAIAEAMKEALPLAAMAAAQAAAQANKPQAAPAGTNKVMHNQRCGECHQLLRACNGEHVQMVVGPKNPRRWNSYPGHQLNGIHYRSNGPAHLISVPKENDFAHRIAVWENGEEDLRNGRELTHYSGHITRGGASGHKANPSGFQGLMPVAG